MQSNAHPAPFEDRERNSDPVGVSENARSPGDTELRASQPCDVDLNNQEDVTSSTADTARIFRIGEVLSARWKICRFIAHGGMGEVYEAEDLELATTVALKTLEAKFAQDIEMLARFRRETLLARKVNHPNVCRMYDIGRHRHPALGDILFLTMEYLSGETLRMHLLRSGPFNPADALSLVRQMSSGLQAAHDVGVVHRDFKASNVMLIASDRGLCVKITDFGLARSLAILVDEITVQGMIIGTPSAMAPEQFRGISSPASDIYSLGIVMREIVTASWPTTRQKRAGGLIRNEKGTLANVDPLWRAAISKCLAQDPSERFARADQVPAALVKSAHVRRPTGFRRYAVALSAFAVAMLLVAIWVFRDSIGHLLGF